MPVAVSIPLLIKEIVEALQVEHAPKTLKEASIQIPSKMRVSLQFCPKNPLSARFLNYTGKLELMHKAK